jgi:membrane-bound lytic murein transglycosylase MltF
MKSTMPKAYLLLSFCLIFAACSDADSTAPAPGSEKPAAAAPQAPDAEQIAVAPPEPPEPLEQDLGIPVLSAAWTGDLDGMTQRRVIRVLTVYGFPRYFLDGATERGLVYELFKLFEEFINKKLDKDHPKVHVVLIPVARDELISGLVDGRGDIAAAGLTITPEREEVIDFTDPVTRELSEVLVTGPSAPPIDSIEGLSGQELHVRLSSSYRASLDDLNRRLRERGMPEVVLRDASEFLEDEDLLEMVNSGMLPWAVVDDYKADALLDVFDGLEVRSDLVLRKGGRVGQAVRKNSPQLLAILNEFLKTHKQGTLIGNVLINRYVRDFDWSTNALVGEDYERFESVISIFENYGQQYGLDYLLVAAQGYQESQLDQSRRSRAGAVGIMQLLPSTARDPNVGIQDISQAENNIHAGIRYLDFIRGRYYDDPAIDHFNKTLFALASYNAGPARIRAVRAKAAERGYDPDIWFDNVELVALQEVGTEPVNYVANILKYYTAYYLIVSRHDERAEERERVAPDG